MKRRSAAFSFLGVGGSAEAGMFVVFSTRFSRAIGLCGGQL